MPLKQIRKLWVFMLLPLVGALVFHNAMSLDKFIPVTSNVPDKFRPVIVFESANASGDQSFTDAATQGAEKARKELGLSYETKRVSSSDVQGEVIKNLADEGYNPIIAVGFQNVVPVLQLADKYPATRFTVIDGIMPPLFNNVQSINFKDHEGAFLVGMIAAYKSKTGTVGFVGGMDVPLIRNFATGFKQGVEYAKPGTKILLEMIGATPEAWNNPEKAGEITEKLVDKGADVIFAAAGGSSIGVLKRASELKKFGIGVDINQNGLFPGYVLTSMIKRVDLAVYDVLKNSFDGTWEPGIKYLGIKEYVLDYAIDKNNKDLISGELIDKVEDAKDKITNGLLDIDIYSPN